MLVVFVALFFLFMLAGILCYLLICKVFMAIDSKEREIKRDEMIKDEYADVMAKEIQNLKERK